MAYGVSPDMVSSKAIPQNMLGIETVIPGISGLDKIPMQKQTNLSANAAPNSLLAMQGEGIRPMTMLPKKKFTGAAPK
jgi:hypothetical protein